MCLFWFCWVLLIIWCAFDGVKIIDVLFLDGFFGFACVRAGEICNARLSELFLAQMGSSPLSENYSNSPPLVLSARLREGLSLERDGLAWARTRSTLCFQSRQSKNFSLERETMSPERELLSLSEIDSTIV